MLTHLISQRQVQRNCASYLNSHKQAYRQIMPTHLSIAVGIALSCTALQVQADDTQVYNELPVIDVAVEYESDESPQVVYERLSNPNVEMDRSKLPSNAFVAQQTRLFFECTQVQTSAARLACFDKVAEQGKTPSYTTTKQPLDLAKTFKKTISGNPQVVLAKEVKPVNANTTDTVLLTDPTSSNVNVTALDIDKDEAQILAEVGVTQSDVEQYTPLSLLYDLDANSEQGTWTARTHRPTYLLPLFYSFKPNRNPSTPSREEQDFTSNEMRNTELKLQLSLKTKVAEDLFDTNADMWFGYTQQSHWQVYNEDNSRPFRATDYQPEIFLTQPVKANLPFGGRLRMLGAGAMHHSNGQSDELSRSWNRVYLLGGAEWGKFSVVPRIWARVNGDSDERDDNPDIEDFMGHGDVTFLYTLPNEQSVSGTLRYNTDTNNGAARIDYVYPLSNNINGYVQLFHGYGESIIDYNHKNTAIGFGIVLNDWKGL